MVDQRQSSGEQLRRRARRIIQSPSNDQESSAVVLGVVREIGLVLDQIDRWEATRKRLQHSLLRIECYTDTELMQMESRTPRYSPYRFPEREKFQRRLLDIEKERRRLEINHKKTVMDLENRLFTLIETHAHLSGD